MILNKIKSILNLPVEHLTNFKFSKDFTSLYATTKAQFFKQCYPKLTSKISRADAKKWYIAMANDENFECSTTYITVENFIALLDTHNHRDLSSALSDVYC